MVFIRAKMIHGARRYYLEHSARLSDGRVKKVSLYLPGYNPATAYPLLDKYRQIIEERITRLRRDSAVQQYTKHYIFTEEVLQKLEQTKQGYQKILHRLTEKQFSDVLDRFTVNFTYESNALEGNSLTLKDVTFIIQEGKIMEGQDLREVYETINTRQAFDWIIKQRPKIEEKDILKLHEILVQNTGVSTGYKKLPNFLVGRMVKTTPPPKVKKEMDELIGWYNENSNLHPLQRATLFHGRFEKIHPFEDGNGRVGRLLINIILLNNGFAPLIIRKTQRVRYFHALEAFDNGHPDNLYRFILEKYKKTYEKFFQIYLQYL